jgi:hypothetical protein
MSLKLKKINFEDAFCCKHCRLWFRKTFKHQIYKEYCKACICLYREEILNETKVKRRD